MTTMSERVDDVAMLRNAPAVGGVTILVRLEDTPLPYAIPRRVGEVGALLVAHGARDVYAASGMDWAARERHYLLLYRDRFGDEQQVDLANAPAYADALDRSRDHWDAIPASEPGWAMTRGDMRERDRLEGLRTRAELVVLDALQAPRPLAIDVRGEDCSIVDIHHWRGGASVLVHHGPLDRDARREWVEITEDVARAILETAAAARRGGRANNVYAEGDE